MSFPLAIIGDAVLEVIGLNPAEFNWTGDATWVEQGVFDSDPFYQPTANGPRKESISLATRPHVFGGLQAIEQLKRHMFARQPVLFIRLLGGYVGEVQGMVAITRMTRGERKLAPDGRGWRVEATVELLYVGEQMLGGAQWQ